MAALQKCQHHSVIVVLFILGTLWEAEARQICYSIPEELDKDSFMGNIADDLGLGP